VDTIFTKFCGSMVQVTCGDKQMMIPRTRLETDEHRIAVSVFLNKYYPHVNVNSLTQGTQVEDQLTWTFQSIRSQWAAIELRDMEQLLDKHGYDPQDARRLQDEGMGVYELEHRLKTGDLWRTHGLVLKYGAFPSNESPSEVTPSPL
jgi:hypothetical protein